MMMKYPLLLLSVFALAACGQFGSTVSRNPVSAMHDTVVQILWRELKFDTSIDDSVSTIVINKPYCRDAPDAIKAAIGFTGTFIGSDCQWDGETTEKMSNLSCKLITSLGLGYQCSEKHLGFLRHWLRNEPTLLKRLESCPVIPFTASRQETFDEMTLKIRKDTLIVSFKANGINMPEEKSWTWGGIYVFRATPHELHLVSEYERKPEYDSFFD